MSKERVKNHMVRCNACMTVYPDDEQHVCPPTDYPLDHVLFDDNPSELPELDYANSVLLVFYAFCAGGIVAVVSFIYMLFDKI